MKCYGFSKKSDNQYGKSSHFDLKNCISCLGDKVYIFGRIFMKFTQVLYENSFNPTDFSQNQTISMGKVAILI